VDGVRKPRARLRVPVTRLAAGEHALGPAVARYVAGAHRLRAGDTFVAFDPERGLEADCDIVALTAGDLTARVGVLRAATLVATCEVTWVQGLPKGEKMDDIVRDATELGATRIIPATTTFTVVKLEGPRREARRQRWERIANEAARQCGRSDAPEVLAVMPWGEALAKADASPGAAFCLYERATVPLGPALLRAAKAAAAGAPFVFAAGPEGGLSEDEVALAAAHGFASVSLGRFVLRAETVAAATLGALGVVLGMCNAEAE
jgi:16S rRNA (uracil1498-N3)-methyltransferase